MVKPFYLEATADYFTVYNNNKFWAKSFRLADDYHFLVNSLATKEKFRNAVKQFLHERGLSINLKKTVLIDISKGKKFTFVGSEFAALVRDGENKIYNYFPAKALLKCKEKVNAIFHKYQYYLFRAFYKANEVIRGWTNLHA